MSQENLFLMIPGPVLIEEDVLNVMGGSVHAHYGPEWTAIYKDTVMDLKKILGTTGDVFILVGSGSSGLDAAIGSAFSSGEKVLIAINGFFGERLRDIARSYGLNTIEIQGEWGKPFDLQIIEDALRQNPDAVGLLIVHLETSTTIINPVQEIGRLVRERGALFVVDAVSSLGGIPLKMDEWNIDACVSASQKCLGAPPGLSPVAVGERAWEKIRQNPMKNHGWYLNLQVWKQYADEWGDWHPFPITMATNNVLALRKSVKNLLREGVEQRMLGYRYLALNLRNGLRHIGYEPFTPDEWMAPTLTAAYVPEGVIAGSVVKYMSDQYHIKIAGGLGSALKDRIIRIGHMSPLVDEKHIDKVVQALKNFQP